jgi:chromatin remodeling complex protein RSC6
MKVGERIYIFVVNYLSLSSEKEDCRSVFNCEHLIYTHFFSGGSMEQTEKTTRKPNAAFMKAMTPSAELAEVVGANPLARTEAVSRMWEYIKANNLQNPANKRNILADAKLKKVFGKDEVTMFELTGLIGKHLN